MYYISKITTGVHEEQASEERSDSKVVYSLLLELIHERMPFSPTARKKKFK